MSKVRIYNNAALGSRYYILQGAKAVLFDIEKSAIHRENTLHLLSFLARVSINEIPQGTPEYSHVLEEYKEVINRLPLREANQQIT